MSSIIDADEFDKLFSNISDRENFKHAKEKLQNSLLSFFQQQKFSEEEERKLQERLYRMIDYAIRRLDDYSTQRHRYLTLATGLIGFSAAFLGIYANNFARINSPSAFFAALGLFLLILSGIIVVLIYNCTTTPDYPHRQIMDIKSWYFIYKFDKELKREMSKNITQAKSQVEGVARSYLNGVEDWITSAKKPQYFIKEDIEQVATLHLLQKYGRDSLDNMKTVMTAGIVLFGILLLVSVVLQVFLEIYK